MMFGFKKHLEDEIEYLKAQLAQKQRRVDELQEALIAVAKPSPKVVYEKKPDGKLVKVQPNGWEEVRNYQRNHPEEVEEPEAEGPYKLKDEKEKNAKS